MLWSRFRRVFADVFAIYMAVATIALALVMSLLSRTYRAIDVEGAVSIAVLSGLAAMITVETVKRLLPLRGWYNSRKVTGWLRRRGEAGFAIAQLENALGRGAVHGRFSDAFNLPAEQLSAQINAAVERVLRDSREPTDLLTALCPTINDADIERLRRSRSDSAPDETSAIVAYEISSAIDQLQIHLAGQWRHYLQITSWWLAGVFGLLLAAFRVVPDINPISATVVALTAGGFIGWFARDLTAVVEGLRR
jgi:hypothetical protein